MWIVPKNSDTNEKSPPREIRKRNKDNNDIKNVPCNNSALVKSDEIKIVNSKFNRSYTDCKQSFNVPSLWKQHWDNYPSKDIDIRTTKVTEKELGGVSQHIGAYETVTDNGKRIVFRYKAFSAMLPREAKVIYIIIEVVVANDSAMVQTKEAISHTQVVGCPIVIAINKIDKPQANPERTKEDLASYNSLVEDKRPGPRSDKKHMKIK